jgi:two-component system cell cycle response regulator
MSARILLIDGSPSQRMVLKARLVAACHEVTAVPDLAAATSDPRPAQPDLVIFDLPPSVAAADRQMAVLRADPWYASVPVVALCPPDVPGLRCAALAAGADEVISRPADETLLLARLRNLLRRHEGLSDLATGPADLAGLAEAATGFDGPGTIAVLAARPEQALRLKRDLEPLLRDRIRPMTRAEALGDPLPEQALPDVFLVETDFGGAGGGLRMLCELVGHGAARHAAVCLIRTAAAASGEDAMAFDLGASDVIAAGTDPQEIALRLRVLLRRKRAADGFRERLRDGLRLAMTDPLTGLHNRRYADGHLALMAERARSHGEDFAVMVLDLDRFKLVNDTHGHAAGDAVLVEVGRRLAGALRADDLLARIGGEEFLIALPAATQAEAQSVAERIARAVQSAPFRLPSGAGLSLTASIGVAVSGPDEADCRVHGIVERADLALLRSKASGRNQITVARVA